MSYEQYQPTQREPLEHEVKILAPLYVPKAALDNGFSVLMAIKYCNWNAKIPNPNAGQENEPDEIDNPISAVDAYADRIKSFVKEEAKAMLSEQGAMAGRAQADAQFNALFGG